MYVKEFSVIYNFSYLTNIQNWFIPQQHRKSFIYGFVWSINRSKSVLNGNEATFKSAGVARIWILKLVGFFFFVFFLQYIIFTVGSQMIIMVVSRHHLVNGRGYQEFFKRHILPEIVISGIVFLKGIYKESAICF